MNNKVVAQDIALRGFSVIRVPMKLSKAQRIMQRVRARMPAASAAEVKDEFWRVMKKELLAAVEHWHEVAAVLFPATMAVVQEEANAKAAVRESRRRARQGPSPD